MKTRSSLLSPVFIRRLLVLAACLLPALRSSATTIPTYQWTGNHGTYNWEDAGNWLNNLAPSAQTQPGNVVFPAGSMAVVSLGSTLPVQSLTFEDVSGYSYPYSIYSSATSPQNPAALFLGAGGITVGNTNGSTVYLAGINLGLQSSQTWTTNGNLTVYGPIMSGNVTRTLTKAGNGYLSLNSPSPFVGGLTVSAGTLYVSGSSLDSNGSPTTSTQSATSGPVGTGTLTLQDNTALAANNSGGFSLANNVTLGNGVHFVSPLNTYNYTVNPKDGYVSLTLGGNVTAAGNATTVWIDPINRVEFSGRLSGPSGTAYTFTGGGTAVLSGTTAGDVSSLTADHAAIFLASPASVQSIVKLVHTID